MFSLKHALSLACMICISSCTASSKPTQDNMDKDRLAPPLKVEQLIEKSATDAQIPGVAVAYINNGKLQWIATYGKANEQNSVARDSLFNVASLTKPVFSMLTLKLVQDGKLSLDESLSNYWIDPDVKDDPRHNHLTPRLALSHQTGFTNWRGDNPLSFLFEPGSRHEYSGEGFEYLLRAIENKTDTTMPQLMESYITAPLNMTNTYFGWQADMDANISARYDESAQEIAHKGFYKESYSAACCTLTTIHDYSKFIAWVGQGAGLSYELLSDIQTVQSQHDNPVEYYGLGWRLIKLPETTYLMHDGREPGVRTFTTVSTDTGEGLVILTNSSNGELLYRPLIEAALSVEKDYLAQTDRDTWLYLTSVPKEVQPRMIQFIAQSPSFVSKALYAANEEVFAQSTDDQNSVEALRAQSEIHIEQYIQDMLQGKANGQSFIDIMNKLFSTLNSDDSSMELKEWVKLLKKMKKNA